MREVGIWRIPTVFITHPDIDHFGALPELIEPLGIRRVLVGERFIEQAGREPEGTAAILLNFVNVRGVEVVVAHAGDSFAIGDSEMNLVSPPPGAPWPKDNDQSLMAVVRVPAANGTRTLMLTGDAQAQAIGALRESHPDLAADILEVPHHGSAIPESIEWAYSLAPSVVMQSTGASRALDPRWSPVRDRCAWYTTCLDGAAWAEIGRDGDVRHGSLREARK
jgi:competence protein ComEC